MASTGPRGPQQLAPAGAMVDCVDLAAESALCVIDPTGRVRFANGALRLVLGLNLLQTPAVSVHPDDAAQLAHLVATGHPRRLHVRFPNVAGGWVRIELDCHPVGASHSLRVLAASPSLSDPSARNPGDRWAAGEATVGIYAVQRGRFTYVNPAFERITSYPAAELIGMRALDLVVPEDRRALLRSAARVVRGDRWLQYEYRIRTRDGHIRWLTENLSPLMEFGMSATLGSCLDVSSWRAAAEALRKGGRRLADVSAGTPDMLALTGPAGRFLFVNDAHAQVLGYSPRELLGLPALGLVHADDQASVYRAVNACTGESEAPAFEVRVAHKSGHWVWIETRLEVIRDAAGNHNGTVIISRDTTLRRRAEHEIQSIAQELRAPTEALAAFAYRVARGEASALFLVSAYAQLLARRYDSGEGADADAFIRAVAQQTTRLQSLIVDLLAAAGPSMVQREDRRAA